jgi:hypothetical protein
MEPTGIEPVTSNTQPLNPQGDTPNAESTLAYSLARVGQFCQTDSAADAELQRVISAWRTLPEHVRAAIMALVATGRGTR